MSNSPVEMKPMRDLKLHEVHSVVKYMQGEMLTFIEASISDVEQRKAWKDIFNNAVSRCLSHAQDIAWRIHDNEETNETVLPQELQ